MKVGSAKVKKIQADHFEHFYHIEDSGCWLWMAGRHRLRGGYGGIYVGGGKHERAHRYSWKLHRGPIPAGMHVLHKCDRPPCVNPDHLFLGTNADNVADKVAKGRAAGWTWGKVK